MLAERQAGRPVRLRCIIEEAEALRKPPGLYRYPRATLRHQCDKRRANLHGRGQRLVQAAQRLRVAALLGFNQRQVVRAQHRVPRVSLGIGEYAVVDGLGLG